MHWKSWQIRLTKESETQIRESYSSSWLFLISSAQHKEFEFSIQLIVIIFHCPAQGTNWWFLIWSTEIVGIVDSSY